MRRFSLDVLTAKAASLETLGRSDEAASVRARGEAIAGEIAAAMEDADLRSAFLESTSARLTATG